MGKTIKKILISMIFFTSLTICMHVNAIDNEGLTIENGKKYYYENNEKVCGFRYFGEDLYFFSSKDKAASAGWKMAYGNVWYQNEEGIVVRGLQEIEGKKYYFNEETGYQEIGFKKVGEDLYFFSSKDKTVSQGWKMAYGNVWYQNEEGIVVRGPQIIDGKQYYFDYETGYRASGFHKVGDKIMFFSSRDGLPPRGWQTAYGNHWYQDENGALVTGEQVINGRAYRFSEETGFLEGFKIIAGKTYYYNPDGTQAKGIEYMMDQFLKFDNTTGEYEKNVRQIRVIDISHNNGNIDWNKVKQSGLVDAVILRIGFGIGYRDRTFEYNKNELERLGIPYSIYLFSYAENADESLRESNWLIELSNEYKVNIATNIFSIYYDLEDWKINSTSESSDNISKEEYGKMITTFVENTEKNMCIKTKVYASTSFINNRFPDSAKKHIGWVADWRGYIGYDGDYEGWQYTSEGQIPGISGNVDMNLFYY